MEEIRPVLLCLVAYPLSETIYFGTALVDLEVAARLHAVGWIVIGPDPSNEIELASFLRARQLEHRLKVEDEPC